MTHAPHDLLRVILSDHCLADEDTRAGVDAIDEIISGLDVQPSTGFEHLLVTATPQIDKADLASKIQRTNMDGFVV